MKLLLKIHEIYAGWFAFLNEKIKMTEDTHKSIQVLSLSGAFGGTILFLIGLKDAGIALFMLSFLWDRIELFLTTTDI